MMRRPITRVLVVGLGSIGRRHLRLLRARLPAADIMVLRHSDCEGPMEGANACTTDLATALRFAPDLSIIATPAPWHIEPALALAGVGSAILLEKPMAVDAADAARLVASTRDTGLVQIGYNLRFLDSLATFRTAILDGRIGAVGSVRAEVGQYLPDWRPDQDWRQSASARAELGGGALLELSHELDYLRWIFGPVAWVRAWLGQQGGFGLAVEDTAHLLLGFAKPCPDTADHRPPVASVTLDFIRRDTTRHCVAIGTQGTLSWNAITSEVRLVLPGQADQILFSDRPERDATYRAQLDAMIASIETGTPIAIPATDGLDTMLLIDALRRSHRQDGRTTALAASTERPS